MLICQNSEGAHMVRERLRTPGLGHVQYQNSVSVPRSDTYKLDRNDKKSFIASFILFKKLRKSPCHTSKHV